jgi:hypothetical protein
VLHKFFVRAALSHSSCGLKADLSPNPFLPVQTQRVEMTEDFNFPTPVKRII